MQFIKVMLLTYLIIKNETTKVVVQLKKSAERVVDVKKDVEDNGNIDGWDEKDFFLRSWISCNLKK